MHVGIYLVSFLMATLFVGVPAKFLYGHVLTLKPLARATFALTAPVLFLIVLIVAYALTSKPFNVSYDTYLGFAISLFAVSFAVLIVFAWYRCLVVVAGYPGDAVDRVSARHRGSERIIPSPVDPHTLKRHLRFLDWSFFSLFLAGIYCGMPGHSPVAGVILAVIFLIALGTLVARLGESWITAVGLSLICPPYLFVAYIRIHIAADNLIRRSRALSP
jgi:hypothetical protein